MALVGYIYRGGFSPGTEVALFAVVCRPQNRARRAETGQKNRARRLGVPVSFLLRVLVLRLWELEAFFFQYDLELPHLRFADA